MVLRIYVEWDEEEGEESDDTGPTWEPDEPLWDVGDESPPDETNDDTKDNNDYSY